MIIFLDTMIVQYCSDYEDFVFGHDQINPGPDDKLKNELAALRQLVELDQLANWSFAAPAHLMKELLSGRPTLNQTVVYEVLRDSWAESEWYDDEANEEQILIIEHSLAPLKLRDVGDRRNLAEAIALGASWFLTNDKGILNKTRKKPSYIGQVKGVWVARPSECIPEISVGLFLR